MLGNLLDDDNLRPAFKRRLHKDGHKLWPFQSADHPDNDPAPAYDAPPKTGARTAWLVTDRDLILEVLRNPHHFESAPYAPIGGNRFMLAMDSVPAGCAHERQRRAADTLLKRYGCLALGKVGDEAVRQAEVAALQQDRFDLADFSALAALRFCQLWFGFGADDLRLLRAAALDGYAALVHQIVGRHVSADDTVLPQARRSMALLTRRADQLLTEYQKLAWQGSRHAPGQLVERRRRLAWPEGVDPPDEWNLSDMGDPLLKRMALAPGDFTTPELASIAVGLIVGTVGNVQSACCRLLARWMRDARTFGEVVAEARAGTAGDAFAQRVIEDLASNPPVVMLPRRAKVATQLHGQTIDQGADLLLWLAAAEGQGQPQGGCPRDGLAFGGVGLGKNAAVQPDADHACLGHGPGRTVIIAILRRVLQLPGLAEEIDPVTGLPEGLSQRWGFACTGYPLRHQRKKRLAQQPLNVMMRVKAPVDEHAQALQRVIAAGAPRIERALLKSRHVHFAWFELIDQGRTLVLHTVYDGNFDDYVQHFALAVDDLFDRLFEHIEDAPPLPVAEHPGAFVNVIRAHHQPQLAGYFFSAYPGAEVRDVTRQNRGQP